MSAVQILLFLHVLGAIIAFGPTFAYSIMAVMAGKEPQHANYTLRQTNTISHRLVYPLAVFQGITGVLLILAANIDTKALWLVLGIVLYLVALGYSFFVQRPAVLKMIELTSTPPAPGTPPAPEIPALGARIRRGGMLLGLLIVIIVFLMVVKPTL